MAKKNLTADGSWDTGLLAECSAGYRTLAYNGALGGGTLRVWTTIDGVETPVPDSKLTAASVDGAGDALKQLIFAASGTIAVKLTGSSGANVDLMVQ